MASLGWLRAAEVLAGGSSGARTDDVEIPMMLSNSHATTTFSSTPPLHAA